PRLTAFRPPPCARRELSCHGRRARGRPEGDRNEEAEGRRARHRSVWGCRPRWGWAPGLFLRLLVFLPPTDTRPTQGGGGQVIPGLGRPPVINEVAAPFRAGAGGGLPTALRAALLHAGAARGRPSHPFPQAPATLPPALVADHGLAAAGP